MRILPGVKRHPLLKVARKISEIAKLAIGLIQSAAAAADTI